ncbi:Putative DDT domain, WHIM2 domain, WHIM1 domain-containing protein [Septoria linicola]|uniref:DDT domain, WHIM2 domain, WHIM1 domain-containing protein n=1 Tax=Septoria linicola TaxID=215465 RepID=A0A9Q9ATL7_9PEZI|nr:putative DDT domain, WHIM2 domain, WHIM1 domain-containing protein [Septoria linicola]USW52315.1 Putative DDT domain, WHIM2 domain, WHIM1 domain-containing protein [Septoria linicola]
MVRNLEDTLLIRVTNRQSQVLNKRKPVNLITSPPDVPDSAEIYVMKGTNEVFTDYEKYLKRFDWLNQKKFTDAVNGKSGLNYWDALELETKSQANIETLFPEVLRDPILRNVQFSTVSRMDELVNKVFDDFKSDYFPGEDVVCTLDSGEQFGGTIREKAKFPMIRGADGSVQRAPFSRYFIKVHGTPGEEALLDDKHIRRDRKVFTKQNLRAFLKNSLQRESWSGAPWLVKEHLAIQYRLPMEIPQHLFQDAKLMNNKIMLSMRPPKNKKPKNMSPAEYERLRNQELQQLQHQQMQQQQIPGAPAQQVGHYQQQQQHHQMMNQVQPRPAPAPVVKYPIEDLDLAPKRNGVTRPELKFFTDELTTYMRSGRKFAVAGIEMKSMGMLLEVWNTLNVQCEVYVLDSFTFDDFVDAMQYSELDPPCELLEEIHCAVLKLFVDEEGKLLVKDMPRQKIEEPPADDDTEMQDDSEVSTPIPDAPARSTRSRLSHMEVAEPESPAVENRNRASEMLGDRTWERRLAARDFANGGWQVIVVGLLHQLSQIASFKERCEKILAHLAPIDAKPTQETALEQYASMDINLRITALQILTVLTIRTDAIKDFLETCMDDMTDVRKRKIEHQREKKIAMEEFAVKDREFKILRPDHLPPSPVLAAADTTEVDATEDSIDLNGTASSPEPDGDAPVAGRSLRRAGDRKRKREEDQARREKEKAEKAEAAKAHNKAAKEFKKIEKECADLKERIRLQEEKIAECDSDLREANVQRTKVLGKDRFCNRYYWFERNGQPFGGLPNSSTSAYGYANGRIWVQGPDAMEREGFIERTPEDQREYQRYFQMTVQQRRDQEEGGVQLNSADEWGYIDDPDRLDNLIGWLDDRGERERKLRKELLDWRDKIAEYMGVYKNFLDQEAAKKIDSEEESTKRVSTRHKLAEEEHAARARCLRWSNTMVLDDLGRLHSQPPKPKEKKSHKKQAVAEREDRGRGVAVPINRGGKPMTRQGADYNFKK